METIFFIIICIWILTMLKLMVDYNIDYFTNDEFKINDLEYYEKFLNSNKINTLVNNNKLKIPKKNKNKILFITFDNRENQEYLTIHNSNIDKYVKKYGYEYKYFNNCDKNVYWCKIYMVLEQLKTNKYDYVVWLDSDTIIKKFDIDIGDIFNMFSSDIYVGLDNHAKYKIINAGVFAVANTNIGTSYLTDCINYVNPNCFNSNGSLNGNWAATCYEQGVMNILIHDKYFQYTTVLTNKIILNYSSCLDDVFIMHLYASTPNSRTKCFASNK